LTRGPNTAGPGDRKGRIQGAVAEIIYAVRNISRDPEQGEMNGQYVGDSLEIVLPSGLHSGQTHDHNTGRME